MLDPKRIRESFEEVKAGLSARRFPLEELDKVAACDVAWRKALMEVEQLKSQRNTLTPKGKPTPEQLQSLKQLSDTVKEKESLLLPLEQAVHEAVLTLPNVPHSSVPVGASEEDNVQISTWGEVPQFDFPVLSHDQIGEKWGVMDFEGAVKVTGARFVLLKRWAAKLERAIAQLMLDTHTNEHGYEEVVPPYVVNSASLTGTGQLPKFSQDLFRVQDTDFWLSPTSEVQLTNMYRDTIIDEAQLPVSVTAFTPCFRSEAGSYGKDTSGIIRQHQFHKVELVRLVHPDQSLEQLELLKNHAQTILEKLRLPYRTVLLCTGDMGFSSGKTYDLEVWMPAQNKYREISSCSNFFDFQSRRAMIRCRLADSGKVVYLHTLNGSGLAVGRTMAAILENYQQKDGTVRVPDVLIPYMGVNLLG